MSYQCPKCGQDYNTGGALTHRCMSREAFKLKLREVCPYCQVNRQDADVLAELEAWLDQEGHREMYGEDVRMIKRKIKELKERK